MMTNLDATVLYIGFNKRYFSNGLPKDLVVAYAHLKHCFGLTECFKNRPLYILLDWELRKSMSHSALTILHEMVHVRYPKLEGHGPRFHKEMLRLAKAGAMRPWW
jgi:hypothetical protein